MSLHHQLSRILMWRTVQAVFVSLFVGMLCFFATQRLGGNIAYRIAGGRYGYDLMDADSAKAVTHELGLDRSIWARLWDWTKDSLSFNFGESLISGAPVVEEVGHTLGHSMTLAGASLVLSIFIAIPLGLMAAKRPNAQTVGWIKRSSH